MMRHDHQRSAKCSSTMRDYSLHWQAQKLCGMVSAQLDEKATLVIQRQLQTHLPKNYPVNLPRTCLQGG